MKTFIVASAVALLLGFGPVAAYDGDFTADTPSMAFGSAQTYGGGANLSLNPVVKQPSKRAISPSLSYDEIIGGSKTPSRVFH